MPVNVPIAGQAAVIAGPAICAVQSWAGLPAVLSPRSSTTAKPSVLGAVHPPDEAENMV